MQKLKVGQLLQEGKTKYQEGVIFDFQQAGPLLYLFFNSPTETEIESIKKGEFEIGFYQKDEVIFIMAKFQGMPWMDAPYSVHLSQPFEFQEITEGKGFGLTTLLVDANTGILKAIRYSGLSTEFSRKLRIAIENQKNISWDERSYNQKIDMIYDNYSTDDLVRRADAICKVKE
jgi:hypothetical protein